MMMTMKKNRGGFSLVELLVVAAMLAIVMTAVYSLYISHQRHAYTSEEVVEVQQNLRIAMDRISRDIRMAGFLIPQDDNAGTPAERENTPISSMVNDGAVAGLGTADSVVFNTASAAGRYARINAEQTGITNPFTVDAPISADSFDDGLLVRIIRSQSRSQPTNTIYLVQARNRTVPSIQLAVSSGDDPSGTVFTNGDVIALTSTATQPEMVRYCVGPSADCGPAVTTCPTGQFCLMRVANGTAEPVATNITGLQFQYILDDNTRQDVVALANRHTIRAVRVVISASTATTVPLSGNQAKDRQIDSVVMLRNR